MRLSPFFFVLSLSLLVVGCRSSRSGTSHSELETNNLTESRTDSTDLREKLSRYFSEQESTLKLRVIEFYPSQPGDTAAHGGVKSITDIDLSSKTKSDSTISEKQLTVTSDTTSARSYTKTKDETTYKIKSIPWYQPFIPYVVLVLVATILYYFRRKK